MATLFKSTRPYPLPESPEIVDRDGRPHLRLKERGKAVFHPVSKDGKKYLKESAKWYGQYKDYHGVVRRVPLSENKEAAQKMLADILNGVRDEKAGIVDTYSRHRTRLLTEHLMDYKRHQLDKGSTVKQAKQTVRRCTIVFEGCRFVQFKDVDSTAAECWLSAQRMLPKDQGGIGAQTHNHYITALKSFGNWLVEASRLRDNPFRHLNKVNIETDIRHVRRPLTDDEFTRLILAARTGKPFRGLSGPDRAVLYMTAAYTGLRASEVASLTPRSFDLTADPPTVTVAAAYSKHRREDRLPLHETLTAIFKNWLVGKESQEIL